MSDHGDDDVEDDSIASRRSRRSRGDKGGRLAALERLKNTRKGGVKNKYEVKDLENVYDVVDEDTYSKTVNNRLKDDWIVDDGTGYCETGHELFDDDLLDDDGYGGPSKRKNKAAKSKKDEKLSKAERENQKQNFHNVRDMLTNMPAKRKRDVEETSSATCTDDVQAMLDELNEEQKTKKVKPDLSQGAKLLSVLTNMPMKRRRDEAGSSTKGGDHCFEDILHEVEKRPKPGNSSSSIQFIKKKTTPVEDVHDIPESFYDDDGFDGFDPPESVEETKKVGVTLNAVKVKVEKDVEKIVAPPKIEVTRKEAVKEEPAKDKPKHALTTTMHNIIQNAKAPAATITQLETNVECMTIDGTGNDRILNFYWFDIYEEPRNPGVLYLFGKVSQEGGKGFISCCVVIKKVQRCVYILPRLKMRDDENTDVELKDVYEEFEKIAPRLKISEFKSRKADKKYCFGEANVPRNAEYMEVFYSGTLPALPEDLQGNTFSRVFGTHSSMLENFVLNKKLKGPCWLQIKSPVQVDSGQQQSWCKIEFSCDVGGIQIHPKKDSLEVPPFVVASLNISSVNDAASKKDTIISASVVVNRMFKLQSSVTTEGLFHDSFCLLNKPPGEVWPFDLDRALSKVKFATKMDSERSMLACLLAKLSQFDPDIYVGHDLNLDLLLLQLWNHKVPHWSRIGRLKRTSQPQKGGKLPDSKSAVAGRLVCDVKISAMELIRARSYDLSSLASIVLGLNEDQISSYTGAELRNLFESSDGIQHLAEWGMSLSILNLRLVNELQVMPLALQITTIAGNTLARTLMGGRSERNEFLLLHAFYNKEYIVPDKQFRKKFKREDEEDDAGDKKGGGKSNVPSYVGGLVLEPKKGFYDNFIVLMDFLSLYPSIIQEFNICFTTTTTETHTDDSERGILPEEIRKLVQSRREVKKLMQAENVSQDLKRQYDIRQKALKLTANSMYGCLGFRNSRFFAKNLAALITGKGRDILMRTKEAVETMGFEVIYGDTDSLMINTNTQEIQKVYQIGNKIRLEINRMYKLLELEIDGVFRFLLLLKKKKYAAMLYNVKSNGEIETTLELKGLDIVRRDWAPVAATTARAVLDEIMTEQALDDKIFKVVKILNDKAAELRAGSVPMKDLLITKQLAKNPEEYKNQQGLYHVAVATRMNQSGKLPRKFKNGDTVPYLFCTDGLPHHPVELMESKAKEKIEEAKTENEKGDGSSITKKETVLETDVAYYLSQQVHPVVSRICEPIPGLDAARIAESLGMDPSSYKRKRVIEHDREDIALGEVSEAEKYRDCLRFKFACPIESCKKEIVVESALIEMNKEWVCSLSKCPHCSTPLTMPFLLNSLVLFMRKFIEKYYQGWFMCEDPACPNRERGVNLRLEKNYMVCPCKQGVMVKEYTDSDLHKQFSYLLYIFAVTEQLEKLKLPNNKSPEIKEAENVFGKLTVVVKNQLSRSAYSEVRLGDIFAELIPKDKGLFRSSKKGKDKKPVAGTGTLAKETK